MCFCCLVYSPVLLSLFVCIESNDRHLNLQFMYQEWKNKVVDNINVNKPSCELDKYISWSSSEHLKKKKKSCLRHIRHCSAFIGNECMYKFALSVVTLFLCLPSLFSSGKLINTNLLNDQNSV